MQKTVYCRRVSEGKTTVFSSICEAAKYLFVDEYTIRKSLKRYNRYITQDSRFYLTLDKSVVESFDTAVEIPLSATTTKTLPRILILDIETAPAIVYAWRLWDANLSHQMVKQDWYIISIAAKWLDEYSGTVLLQTPEEARCQDDTRIVREAWELLDQAEILIVHNGKSFDIPKLNTRFLLQNLPPPSPYQVIDTKLAMNGGNMAFLSNSLDYLTRMLDIDHKGKTEFQLWIDCMAGFESALENMARYNYNDVIILEQLYLRIRPWIRAHPNLALLVNPAEHVGAEHVCPVCLSHNHDQVDDYITTANRFISYRCDDCGTVSREFRNSTDSEFKKHLLSNLPTK
jgi:hypothetical protein